MKIPDEAMPVVERTDLDRLAYALVVPTAHTHAVVHLTGEQAEAIVGGRL
jgi:hypothetical protein